ncbi:MBL fold metallo-hydrolase [Shewanella xiamenensis]|uniref:MBL fold metallo-hydrolase n=1 Tax=Shewanella xiamenensis TaxID=332186 RepID=UPI00118491C2|nr:MBL fold metallo-hydrolase [Shewanella xiamenensis]TVL28644.1 metal-dependent hydrolase [Shewanella xiamenensis]
MSKSKNKFMILGCGHSESLEHFNNNAIIITSAGNMLIDCGYTIKHALHAQSMSIRDIDSIFITHVHGDHVFGLERVAYESKFKYNKRVELIIHAGIYKELWEQTLKGSLGVNGDGEAELTDYFDVTIINGRYFKFHDINIELVPVNHTPGKCTHGIVINKKIFYSSDTIAIPEIINQHSFEVGFHDVTFSNYNPVHATIFSLIESYPFYVRDKLYLMSYEDSWGDYIDLVSNNFKGLAVQGMVVDI